VRGNLGISYDDPRSVNAIIAQDFPVSAAFGLTALIIGLAAGIPLGVLLALRKDSPLDRLGTVLVMVVVSVPDFVIAIVLILVFAVNLHWLTVQFQRGRWQSWVLPLLLYTLPVCALVVRLVRAATLDVLGADYIRTARMKGLTDRIINRRHILRNALVPIVTLAGPLAANVLTGSFIVESIFGIPGIGRAFVTSVVSRDYPLLMGVALFYAALLVFFNLLVDLGYTLVDPRITYR